MRGHFAVTYNNVTGLPIALEYDTPSRHRSVLLLPGQDFTFDASQQNGDTIQQQLESGGAQQV
jgi:hypothetical protein